MAETVETLLSPLMVAEVISQTAGSLNPLASFWNWTVGTANQVSKSERNVIAWPTRDFAYDIFDNTKTVANASQPSAVRTQIAPQVIGHVQGTFPRIAEQVELDLEKIYNLRKLGQSSGVLDVGGIEYINRQSKYIGQRINSAIEFQTAAMMRGEYYYKQEGSSLIHTWSDPGGGSQKIDFNIPSSNKSQLDMLGAGDIIDKSWDDPTSDIIQHCLYVNAAFLATHGYPLENVFCNSSVWGNVLNNDKVKAQAGTSARPFDTLDKDKDGLFTATLRSMPWLNWHIYDNGLDIGKPGSATFEKTLEDNHAYFSPSPLREIATYGLGREPVVIKNTNTVVDAVGPYFWSYLQDNAAAHVIATVHNGLPWLKTPRAIANGTVVF